MKRFIYLFFLVLLVFLTPFALVSSLRSMAARAIEPVGRYLIRGNSSLTNTMSNLGNLSHLYEQNHSLENQVVSLQQQVITLDTVERENSTLRKELGVTGATLTYSKVLAHVTLRGGDFFDRTFTVDVGSASHLKVGQPAVYQGSLIGRVTTVGAHTAVIRSVTSRESLIQVQLADNLEKGLLIGDGSNAYITDITQGVTVKNQDVVETSGLGGSLPEGILVGQTGTIQSQQSDPIQKFLVTLPQDPDSIDSLFILLTDAS